MVQRDHQDNAAVDITRLWILYAAAGCIAGAVLHVVCLIGGARWLSFVGMPPDLVADFSAGKLSPIFITLGIAALLCGLAIYGLSAAGRVRRLPLLRYVCLIAAIVFLLRGLGGTVFLIYVVMKIGVIPLTAFHLLASLFVLSIGTGFWLAWRREVNGLKG